MIVDLQDKLLTEPLARELARSLIGAGVEIAPAAAELVREGVARAVERHLEKRELLTIEELAESFGWSVRRWRAWAAKMKLRQAKGQPDVFRVDDVRAALDFPDERKSAARVALERKIVAVEHQLARLLEAERRRSEKAAPDLSVVRAG